MDREQHSEQDENFREQLDSQPNEADEQQGPQQQQQASQPDEDPDDELKKDAEGAAENDVTDRFKF